MKCGSVTIAGRPSCGKSTLLNALCRAKVAITADVPQTTRNRIRGIVTRPEGQLIFLDTPGLHRSEKKLNRELRRLVDASLAESDLILYLLDASRRPGEEESQASELLQPWSGLVVPAVNKVDLPHADVAGTEAFARERFPRSRVHLVSALTRTGLDELIDELMDRSPEGQPLYPGEYYTDQDPRFRAAEIIREKAIAVSREELPHCLFVEIEDMEERGAGERLWIRAALNVERESQKGILVGHGGARVKAVRRAAQKELQEIFERPISLDLRIKVSRDWRQKDTVLSRLIG